ncbi:MAG: metallophosphoesterase [Hyphomicrobiaceae bacterium]
MTDANGRFRLAQLTDIHLGPLPAFGPSHWNLKRALGYANWQRKRKALHRPEALALIVQDLATQAIDHVAVTGDLVNIGLPDEHEAATRWLAALGSPGSVTVIPGNHDIYTRLWRDHGVARWMAYMTSDDYGEALRRRSGAILDTPFPSVRRLGRVALIGLNSALPTPPGVAAGRVGRRQRLPLARILEFAGDDGLCRVVMVHHPPRQDSGQRLRGLADAAAVRAVISGAGAELVIHGHNHRDQEDVITSPGRATSPIPVIGAASASAAVAHHGEPLARYNIYDITPAGGSWRIDLTIRGLTAPGGRIDEILRRTITPEDMQFPSMQH